MDDIAKLGGRDAFAYAGVKKPWHRKGISVPGLMTVDEGLICAGANFEVTKESIMVADLEMTQIEDYYAVCRNGPEENDDGSLKKIPLGVVKGRYTIVQNSEAFDFFNYALGDGAAVLDTVGVLGKGETVFAIAKLPKTFEVVKGDPIESYLLLSTSHDGSSSIQATFTPIRVVCQNTLTAAISGSRNVVKIRHTKNAKSKLETAHKLLKASDDYWCKVSEAYKSLAMQNMSRLDVIEFVAKMFPGKKTKEVEEVPTRTENSRRAVIGLFNGGATGSQFAPGSKYQMFNAVTEFIKSTKVVRKGTDRWEAETFGQSSIAMRQKALNLLLA